MRADGLSIVDDSNFLEVNSLPDFDDIEQGQLFALSLSNKTTEFTHGLHRFPAKFIPQIPAWALDNFGTPKSIVLDPFSGSGTTLVEGLIRGGQTIGLDIDPMARFIARAKTTYVDEERIRELGTLIRGRWLAPTKALKSPMPDIQNFEHWFSGDQWGWIDSLRTVIFNMKCTEAEREFLLAVFSSTIRRVSNADDQSQKTYVSGTLKKSPPSIRVVFWTFFARAVEGISDLNRKRVDGASSAVPRDGDATSINLVNNSVDLAITSPPYLDSVDYQYNMMLEYFWIGNHIGVETREAFNDLRRKPVGAKSPGELMTIPAVIEGGIDFELLPLKRRRAAINYFAMMDSHFAEVSRCLKDKGRYVFVIGNSQSRDLPLPMHEMLIRMAETHNLQLERAFGYRIRRHYMKFPRAGNGGIILIDWILVLKKGGESLHHASLPLPRVTLLPGAVAN